MARERKFKKQEIELNSKNLLPRGIILGVTICIALGGFGYGIYSLVKENSAKSGWNQYKLKDYIDVKYPGYEENIYLNYYLSENDYNSQNKKVIDTFVSASKDIYALLDSSKYHLYEGINNIGYINSHIGEKVEINGDLFSVLSDAKEKTYLENSTYSMFSGLIQDYWKYFIPNVDMNDYKEPKYLDLYVNYSKDLSNFNLELLEEDDRFYATFTISNELSSFIKDNELEDISLLDLNTLFYSYYLDSLYQRFKEEGLTKGYIYTHTGEMIFMNGSFLDNNGLKLFDSKKYGSSFVHGYLDTKREAYVSVIKSFPVYKEYEMEYFMTSIPGSKNTRSLFYDYRDGYSKNYIKSSTLVNEEKTSSLVDTTFSNLNIVNNEDINKYNELQSSYIACGLLTSEEDTVYVHNIKSYYIDAYSSDGDKISYKQINV